MRRRLRAITAGLGIATGLAGPAQAFNVDGLPIGTVPYYTEFEGVPKAEEPLVPLPMPKEPELETQTEERQPPIKERVEFGLKYTQFSTGDVKFTTSPESGILGIGFTEDGVYYTLGPDIGNIDERFIVYREPYGELDLDTKEGLIDFGRNTLEFLIHRCNRQVSCRFGNPSIIRVNEPAEGEAEASIVFERQVGNVRTIQKVSEEIRFRSGVHADLRAENTNTLEGPLSLFNFGSTTDVGGTFGLDAEAAITRGAEGKIIYERGEHGSLGVGYRVGIKDTYKAEIEFEGGASSELEVTPRQGVQSRQEVDLVSREIIVTQNDNFGLGVVTAHYHPHFDLYLLEIEPEAFMQAGVRSGETEIKTSDERRRYSLDEDGNLITRKELDTSQNRERVGLKPVASFWQAIQLSTPKTMTATAFGRYLDNEEVRRFEFGTIGSLRIPQSYFRNMGLVFSGKAQNTLEDDILFEDEERRYGLALPIGIRHDEYARFVADQERLGTDLVIPGYQKETAARDFLKTHRGLLLEGNFGNKGRASLSMIIADGAGNAVQLEGAKNNGAYTIKTGIIADPFFTKAGITIVPGAGGDPTTQENFLYFGVELPLNTQRKIQINGIE